jgi:DNA-binding NarL/FixJ family response regulator
VTIRVFIADDHTIVCDGLRALLETQPDIEVVGTASDGREALQSIARLAPDVAVMDIAMNELNGIEATRTVSERHPGTRVLILSMYSSAEHIHRALQAGARGYLLKTSAGREVVHAVRAVHAGSRYLSQKIADTIIDDYVGAGRRASPLDELSSRERQVLQLLAEGKSGAVIAQSLSLSPRTVETYRRRVMQKLGMADFSALIKFAIQQGITTPS